MKTSLLLLALTALPLFSEPLFDVTRHPDPEGIDPQYGGLASLSDGRIAVTMHRGEVLIYNPTDESWSTFASGLHEPLGIVAEDDSTFVIMQRAELTRIKDLDKDGRADSYETVCDSFGMTGNYHEFAFGPARDAKGNYFIALNVASNGRGIRDEIRGEWSPIGKMNREEMATPAKEWADVKEDAGRMYSRTPYRGWVLEISPDGKTVTPFASGFRSPNGIGFDSEGNLLVSDNQGDWRGTSPLYTVTKGGHYGHPASLVWREDWDGRDPLDLSVEELDSMRTPASALFPQGNLANSPTQPIAIPASWGPYGGQTMIGEMNQPRLTRYLPDVVNGFRQGSLLPFMDTAELGNGNHRFTFDPEGTLWIGKTHLSWAGAEGLLSVKPHDVDSIHTLTSCKLAKSPDGDLETFSLTFSQELADDPEAPLIKRYRYHYHAAYGSPKVDEAEVPVRGLRLTPDRKTLILTLDVEAGFLHEIDLSDLVSAKGLTPEGTVTYYQAIEIPK